MLYEFLLKNEKEILALSEQKTLELAGARPSSDQLKKGLPIFYRQLLVVFKVVKGPKSDAIENKSSMAIAANRNDEVGMVAASSHPEETELASEAGIHGTELLKLGYTLSHVVHAYGSMCQAITEIASQKDLAIKADEFRDLNRCLDVAIAGAVTAFQNLRNSQTSTKEVEHLGFLAHELRNAVGTVTMSLELIREGTVGFSGSTGEVLDRGLKRIQELVDRSLTEVRLRVEPKVVVEPINLLLLLDQIVSTAGIEARSRRQALKINVGPDLVINGDLQLVYSAISNLIQNALKYTHDGGKIEVRGSLERENVIIEVEDECGGLSNTAVDLFKAFEQQNENRKGLGLGLTIAQRAIKLNHGTIEVHNLPGHGCIFRIALPSKNIEVYRHRESQQELFH